MKEKLTSTMAMGWNLGRGVHYAIAREGALKLKESAYLQAEGYPAGELKHGPNALVSSDAPLVVITTRDESARAAIEAAGISRAFNATLTASAAAHNTPYARCPSQTTS